MGPGGAEATRNLENLRTRGYDLAEVAFSWGVAQPASAQSIDFSQADLLVAKVAAAGFKVLLRLDYSRVPSWLDAEEYGMRNAHGDLIDGPGRARPLLAINAKSTRDLVAGFFKACAAHFREAVWGYLDPGIYIPPEEGCPTHPQLDHSLWATEAFRTWLKDRYVDLRALNEAWDSSFSAWDEIAAGEGVRRSTLADFHLFRNQTFASLTEHMQAAVKAGCGSAVHAYRSGRARMEDSLEQMSFDIGRYARVCDLLVAREVTDSWQINMVRTAANLWGKDWLVGVSPSEAWKRDEEEAAVGQAEELARRVYSLGGGLGVRLPDSGLACGVLEREARRMKNSPEPQKSGNRQAVYVSAAEAQFWDGTDLEAARMRWNEMTESGRKPRVDIISDGMFADSPQVLKRYGGGIQIPFARTVARATRNALAQAASMGVRLIIHNPHLAASLDEHGKPQTPLGG